MTSMWGADPQAAGAVRVCATPAGQVPDQESLKWVIANRAYTPWYLVRYWRLLKFKLANPHHHPGMVFLGKKRRGSTPRSCVPAGDRPVGSHRGQEHHPRP